MKPAPVKPTLAPKLRFPEFRGTEGWGESKLGPMTIKVGSGVTPLGGDKNYKKEGRPFVRSQNVGWGELILDDIAFIDEVTHRSFDSTEIRELDVLLNITGASIGRSAIADSRIAGGNVNQHVCIIRLNPKELDPIFLNQYLISQYGQKQIDSFQAGGNRQGLNFSQIRSFLLPLPPTKEEQIRIAGCLSSLNDLIGSESRKLDALKAHKKGLMQQLFPREGETVPRLRFPEFRDGPGWGSMKVDELVDTVTPPKKLPTALYSAKGAFLIIDQSQDEICGWTDDRDAIIREGLPLIVFGDHTCILKLVDQPFAQGADGIKILSARPDVDAQFLYHYLCYAPVVMEEYKRHYSILKEKIVHFPDIKTGEQHRIASCLSSLDGLIAAQADKIDALKTHKKGLMQQLFPSPEGVGA